MAVVQPEESHDVSSSTALGEVEDAAVGEPAGETSELGSEQLVAAEQEAIERLSSGTEVLPSESAGPATAQQAPSSGAAEDSSGDASDPVQDHSSASVLPKEAAVDRLRAPELDDDLESASPCGTEPDAAVGLFGMIRCRRRASREVAVARVHTAYWSLLEAGRSLSQDQRHIFGRMAWWSEAETSPGVPVFVLVPRGPDGSIDGIVDMWALLSYAVFEMHDHVVERGEKYSVVWVQTNDHRMWSVSMWRFRRSIHTKFFENVHEVHVVHPSWAARFYVLLLWPLADEAFWDRFISHERIEFLSVHLNVAKLMLPKDILEYDEFLDKESQVMTEQAAMLMGGDSSLRDTSGLCEEQERY